MLTQRLVVNADGTATLTIKSGPDTTAQLVDLVGELATRSEITTEGTITMLDPNEHPVIG